MCVVKEREYWEGVGEEADRLKPAKNLDTRIIKQKIKVFNILKKQGKNKRK